MAKKIERIEMVLYGVLSYPEIHNPKPYKGKVYYRTDILFDKEDAQLAVLKKKINKVRVAMWGDDKEEWPKKATKIFIGDGNERGDLPTYHDKDYISVSTQTPIQAIDPKGKNFSNQMVKGGMFAKVAVQISPWKDPDGEEGLSVYLQGIMVDTSKEKLSGFGGGKSARQLFGLDSEGEVDDVQEDDSDAGEVNEDEKEDLPRSSHKNKKAVSAMEEEGWSF